MTVTIGSYQWDIQFVDKQLINGSDGQTKCNDFQILIRNDLSPTTTKLVLTHEIVHALLDTQGRVYQTKFDIEELCEFIAWKLPEINQVVNDIMKLKELNGK